jgi:beta-glucanase (GH16 family)
VFGDEFGGSAGARPDVTKWDAMDWCDNWGSLSCNTDRAQNVALDGQGNLKVVALKEAYTDAYGNGGDYTAARLETGSHFRFTSGTLEARIKVPAGRGLWPSFWTTGSGSWPATGEIDVMEILGQNPFKSYCSVHAADAAGQHVSSTQGATSASSLADGFHVYTARWSAGQIAFELDGRACGSPFQLTGLQPFTAQDIKLGIAVGGDWPGPPDASTPFPATMLVDWVRVYGQ